MRQVYVLDFSATPLEASAGGQFHKVTVDPDGPRDLADTEVHESIEAAISHLILSHELVGGTETFTPLAKVQVWGTGGCRMYDIQAPPPCEAPDYDSDPVKPTKAEVLAAFPLAKDITVTGHTTPRRTFTLHQTRFIVALSDNDHCHVENMDKDNDLEFYRYDCPLAWVAAVRVLGRLVLANEREEIARLSAEAAALAAALGDTP